MNIQRTNDRLSAIPERVLIFLCLMSFIAVFGCNRSKETAPNNSSVKFKQYYVQGKQLYLKHCSNCHQKSGVGLGRVYPPLDSSDFIDSNFSNVLCIIRNGREGELIVNGVSFNQKMPSNGTLTDLEIAEIATYIYNSWSRNRGLLDVQHVTSALDSCAEGQSN
jgi:cytochrome c551